MIKQLKVSIEPKPTRSRISRRKAKAQDLGDFPQRTQSKSTSTEQQEFSQVYQEYQNALAASNLLDYDDLLLRCAELLRAHPECVSNIQAVLIDEFQDTNSVQLELMKLLANKNGRVTVVGDPDQSIYGFRSAEIENLTRMQRYYPDTSIIHLEENYRSSAAVLRCAQGVIEQDSARPKKRLKATHCYGNFPVLRRLPSPQVEAMWIVTEIKRVKTMTANMTRFSDYAILIRSAHLSLLIENALGKAGVPYRMVGGYRFFDREEIRTLLDYLRLISQPSNNIALSAIINVPSRKIGEESLRELLRLADENQISLWAVVQKVTQGELAMRKKLSRPAEQNLCRLISFIKDAKKCMVNMSPESTPRCLLELCIKRLAYKEYVQRKHPEDYENRWANVEELLSQAADSAENRPGADRAKEDENLPEVEGLERRQLDGNTEALATFLANITLSSDLQTKEDGQEQDCVTISTIHSAKGLEWPVVFIPAVYEGSIPHSRAEDTDEERRLLYVAMTRAQALLYLSCPLRQARSDADTTLSSFLPQKLHRYFVQLGPDITEKVLRDVALILRRTCPSWEEVIKATKKLSDRESSQDNLWPADGSAKPKQWWENEGVPLLKEHRSDIVTSGNFQVLQSHSNDSRAQGIGVRTTMTSLTSFTFAKASVGFCTAAQHLEYRRHGKMEEDLESKSREVTVRDNVPGFISKKKEGRTAGGQGSLVNFLARGSAMRDHIANPLPETDLPSYIDANPKPTTHQIPVGFTSHKVSTDPISRKRPQPLQDVSNAKRRDYVFLSSSPTRELHQEPSPEGWPRGETNLAMEQEKILTSACKPVETRHTTSIEMFQEQRSVGARKTYGVRRMMNGWENRKNR